MSFKSYFVGPQPESTKELNKRFLPVENHCEFDNIDASTFFFNVNKDVYDVIAQNFLKKKNKVELKLTHLNNSLVDSNISRNVVEVIRAKW